MPQVITIIFDGGSTCNNPHKGFGKGYGSFKVGDKPIQRVFFGENHSANSSEVRTLVEAIRFAKEWWPDSYKYHVIGDSKIALSWIHKNGLPSSRRKQPTQNFVDAIKLLKQECFEKHITTQWQPRKESVKLFGH